MYSNSYIWDMWEKQMAFENAEFTREEANFM